MSHQNVKLLFEPMRKYGLFPPNITKYQHLFGQMLCADPTENCHRLQCADCPSYTAMVDTLSDVIAEKLGETFSFKQWVSSNRK